MALLYAIAIAVLTLYGANLLWLCKRSAGAGRLIPDASSDPPRDPSFSWPFVTVQLPIFNEPLVVERLLDACAQLDYPRDRFEIQVLDDSTDDTPRLVARCIAAGASRGVRIVHLRRPNREGYKAGALQYGLTLAQGAFIALFDADFVPRPDFLRRLIPAFADERLGAVQARWGHLNQDASLLTRIQAVGLDTHFAVEQLARRRADCFLHFNGTAGVWRRAAIVDAGGWQADTIAEDLDLSYRAQLAGWGIEFMGDVEVPAELPSTMEGLRTQQFRWTKGSVETARKLLRTLWTSRESFRRKVQGTFHMTGHLVFPFVLIAGLLHVPLQVAAHAGVGPGEAYFGWMALGLIGFAGFSLAQIFAQRRLYADWPRRLGILPVFMAGTIGMSIGNTIAVVEAFAGISTPFVRTPKFGAAPGCRASSGGFAGRRAAGSVALRIAYPLEFAMGVYSTAGVAYLLFTGQWDAVVFQLFFAVGFVLVAAATLREACTKSVR